MDRFEDKRINEALELLNAAARDKKAELLSAMESKYTELSSVLSAFGDQVKTQASETYEDGRDRVVAYAKGVDKCVRKNPWPYIGGAAAAALVCGFMLGRSRRN